MPNPPLLQFDVPKPENRDRIDTVAFGNGIEIDVARKHQVESLRQINEEILKFTDGGGLIAVPHCPSACAAGPLSNFLLTLQINPFSRVNTFYCASDLQTALYLDTCVFDPATYGRHDADLIAYFQSKKSFWSEFKKDQPNADTQFILDMRDAVQAEVHAEMAEIETLIYGEHLHRWRAYFGEPIAHAA